MCSVRKKEILGSIGEEKFFLTLLGLLAESEDETNKDKLTGEKHTH